MLSCSISRKYKGKHLFGSELQWTGKAFLRSSVCNSLAVCCDTQKAGNYTQTVKIYIGLIRDWC
jgi:hypothetical protein